MSTRPANDGKPWTRKQLILAFELYCRIPFQRTKATDHRVKALASIIQRTPASIARKLGNFGAFDPQLAAKNISGLSHGSKLDREIWEEFHHDWNRLVSEAHSIRKSVAAEELFESSSTPPVGPSERIVTAKQRLHQSFFRDAVVSSYNNRCCVTGLAVERCLVAGHIIPWSIDAKRRSDPSNGLCMSATFDRLFDAGMMTITEDFTIQLCQSLLISKDIATRNILTKYDNKPITLPTRFRPDASCLQWHRENRFLAA